MISIEIATNHDSTVIDVDTDSTIYIVHQDGLEHSLTERENVVCQIMFDDSEVIFKRQDNDLEVIVDYQVQNVGWKYENVTDEEVVFDNITKLSSKFYLQGSMMSLTADIDIEFLRLVDEYATKLENAAVPINGDELIRSMVFRRIKDALDEGIEFQDILDYLPSWLLEITTADGRTYRDVIEDIVENTRYDADIPDAFDRFLAEEFGSLHEHRKTREEVVEILKQSHGLQDAVERLRSQTFTSDNLVDPVSSLDTTVETFIYFIEKETQKRQNNYSGGIYNGQMKRFNIEDSSIRELLLALHIVDICDKFGRNVDYFESFIENQSVLDKSQMMYYGHDNMIEIGEFIRLARSFEDQPTGLDSIPNECGLREAVENMIQ